MAAAAATASVMDVPQSPIVATTEPQDAEQVAPEVPPTPKSATKPAFTDTKPSYTIGYIPATAPDAAPAVPYPPPSVANATGYTTGKVEMFDGTNDGKEAYLDPSTGATNLKPKKTHNVTVYDIRTQIPRPLLPKNGYEVCRAPTAITEEQFMSYKTPEGRLKIKSNYWPELRELVEAKLGAALVTPWHFSVRNQTPGYHPDEIFFMKTGTSQPAATVHIDNDHVTAMDHLKREVGADVADKLVARYKRWAIVNVWRPVGRPVECWPLLVVDKENVPNWNFDDNIARVYRSNDSTYYKAHDNFLKPHPEYVFRYANRLTPEEVIMFRDYDSRKDGKIRGCPHGGFMDNSSGPDAPPRRSIEVRLFAFFEDADDGY